MTERQNPFGRRSFLSPKPPLLGSAVRSRFWEGVLYKKALRAVSNHSGGLAPTASVYPLASALGNLARRDSGEAMPT